MSILNDLILMFTAEDFEIEDTIAQTTVFMSVKYLGIKIDEVYNCFAKFPKRDTVEIKFIFTFDEVITLSSNTQIDKQELSKRIEDIDDSFKNETIDIRIRIQTQV